MKNIKIYINERLHITTQSHAHNYTCHPKDKYELQNIIIERIRESGPTCDLNDIDVSNIEDMSHLFYIDYNKELGNILSSFNGDVSKWDVSGVTNMKEMFVYCKNFEGDVSQWDVSNVTNMESMFGECEKFQCNISDWDVSKVENTRCMFCGCKKFNCNLSKWDMSKIYDMSKMFFKCKSFRQNIDGWNVGCKSHLDHAYMTLAFKGCPTQPKWYDEDK